MPLYAYARGIRSSRAIERACGEGAAFRVIATRSSGLITRPSRGSSSAHRDAIASLFGGILALCARCGLAKVGVIAVDGTKVHANVSRNENIAPGADVTGPARAPDLRPRGRRRYILVIPP